MLTELRISNFAVIDRLTLECAPGFLVLTGETGAGKSILVDALTLVVGGRGTVEQVRSGEDEAIIEAVFSLSSSQTLADRLRHEGLLAEDESDLIVRRILSRSGRNRIYLNGHPIALHTLQSLAGTLIDIHGQHEQQSLLSPRTQLEALDAFGHLKDLRSAYGDAYDRWIASRHEFDQCVQASVEGKAREDLLRFQHEELSAASLTVGEEELLRQEQHRLAHIQRLSGLADQVYEALYGGERTVLGEMGRIEKELQEIRTIDPLSGEWCVLSEEATVRLQELAARIRDYRRGLEQDPDRLAEIEERLDRLQRLKKKYGGTIEAILAKAEAIRADLEALETSESRAEELRGKVAQNRRALESAGQRLSDGRMRTAKKLEAKIGKELETLRMQHTRFQVACAQDPGELGPSGADRVEFLLSANPGEPVQPLVRVASGGELSRVMLALKTVLAETDRVPVLIFDEVDSGVGGAVAEVMGKRLKALAQYHQVLCITHLPQIASQASTHILVEKTPSKGRMATGVRRLDSAGRREEVARMLGGVSITKAVRDTAAEMLGEN
jgi:DNA repair protein RecN (Recombination protein N)